MVLLCGTADVLHTMSGSDEFSAYQWLLFLSVSGKFLIVADFLYADPIYGL